MPVSVRILVLLCGLAFFWTFLLLAKRGSVKPFYSGLWLLVALAMLSLVIFEKHYKLLADALQIRDASFLVFVGAIVFLLVYVVHLSIKVSELSDRAQELITTVAILEREQRAETRGPLNPIEPHSPSPERKGTI